MAARRHIVNADIARALREMALFLELEDVPFKPQAYEKAAYTVLALERPVSELYSEGGPSALEALPGVGRGIATRIAEMLQTGDIAELAARRKRMPVDLLGLTAIEGIGVKKAHALWDALGIRTVADLKRAAEQGRVRALPHFGERSEERILQALGFHEAAAGRRSLGEVLEVASRLERALAALPSVTHAAVAGSIRRRRDTIGDVDVLVATVKPREVSAAFESLPEVQSVLAHGSTKSTVRLSIGIDADLRVVAPESYGAALLYFTGSKAHNIALRRIAQKRGLKLSEYGLFRGKRAIAGRTEAEVYRELDLAFIPPELREDQGEVELAQADRLPVLVEPGDIRGDLQVHTSWTDGSTSIAEMARAAQALGREYIAITDHTRDLAMTGGLTEARLRAQMREIRKVDHQIAGIRVVAGAEVNIRRDGSFDVDDEVLAELDVVGAAIHSHFELPRDEMTRRVLRAIENPHVDLLLHPFARAIGHRRPIDLDFEAVLQACVQTGTALEIDAQPSRLDLPDAFVRRAIDAGVRIAIDSDAHSIDELRLIDSFGLAVARRGWAERKHVLNALPLEDMLGALKGHRRSVPRTARSAR